MQQQLASVAAGSFLLGAVLFYKIGTWRGRPVSKAELEREQSRDTHDDAVERNPLVDVGDTVTVGVKGVPLASLRGRTGRLQEGGLRHLRRRLPDGNDRGDRLTVTITSFGSNHTSAEAVVT